MHRTKVKKLVRLYDELFSIDTPENYKQEIIEQISSLKEELDLPGSLPLGDYVDTVTRHNSGGGIMVDMITFTHSNKVLGISDDCIVLYPNEERFCDSEESQLDVINFDTRK